MTPTTHTHKKLIWLFLNRDLIDLSRFEKEMIENCYAGCDGSGLLWDNSEDDTRGLLSHLTHSQVRYIKLWFDREFDQYGNEDDGV